MVVEDFWVEVQVSWNQSPGHEERYKTKESTARLVSAGSAGFDNIERTVFIS